MIKKIGLALLTALTMASAAPQAAMAGCTALTTGMQLKRPSISDDFTIWSTCIREMIAQVNSSGTYTTPGSTTTAFYFGDIFVSRIGGRSIGTAGIRLSSSVFQDAGFYFLTRSSMAVEGAGGLVVSYGADLGSATVRNQVVVVGTVTVQGNAFSVGGSTFSVNAGVVTLGASVPLRAASGNLLLDGGSGTGGVYLRHGAGASVDLAVGPTGNIGIGIVNPATQLHQSSGVHTLDGSGSGITHTNTTATIFRSGTGNYTNGTYHRFANFALEFGVYDGTTNGEAGGTTGRGLYGAYFGLNAYSGGLFAWSSTSDAAGTRDTTLSRSAAGVVAVGSGTTANTAGSLLLSNVTAYGTGFSVQAASGSVFAKYGVVASTVVASTATFNRVVADSTTLNSVPYNWPQLDGTGGYVLSTNGSGQLSWIATSGVTEVGNSTTTFVVANSTSQASANPNWCPSNSTATVTCNTSCRIIATYQASHQAGSSNMYACFIVDGAYINSLCTNASTAPCATWDNGSQTAGMNCTLSTAGLLSAGVHTVCPALGTSGGGAIRYGQMTVIPSK